MLGLLVKFEDLGRGLGSDPPNKKEGRTLAAPKEEPSPSPTFFCVCPGSHGLGSLPFLGAGTHARLAVRRPLEDSVWERRPAREPVLVRPFSLRDKLGG